MNTQQNPAPKPTRTYEQELARVNFGIDCVLVALWVVSAVLNLAAVFVL